MGCHFLLQGNLPDPGIEPASPALADGSFTNEAPEKTIYSLFLYYSEVKKKNLDIQECMLFYSHFLHLSLSLWLGHVKSLYPSAGSLKKQESSRKTTISALLTMSKPLTVWITTTCGKLRKRKEYQTTWPTSWEICSALYCLLVLAFQHAFPLFYCGKILFFIRHSWKSSWHFRQMKCPWYMVGTLKVIQDLIGHENNCSHIF